MPSTTRFVVYAALFASGALGIALKWGLIRCTELNSALTTSIVGATKVRRPTNSQPASQLAMLFAKKNTEYNQKKKFRIC